MTDKKINLEFTVSEAALLLAALGRTSARGDDLDVPRTLYRTLTEALEGEPKAWVASGPYVEVRRVIIVEDEKPATPEVTAVADEVEPEPEAEKPAPKRRGRPRKEASGE